MHGTGYWSHKLAPTRLVDRERRLTELCAGRRTAHVGFVDLGLMDAKRESGRWLHERLAQSASELVGIDADAEGVERARALGHESYIVDVQAPGALAELGLAPFEVVVAGELIEHLDRPGAFLDEVASLLAEDGLLVISTPNALRLSNVLGALAGREIVSPEHVAWYSPRTLATLLERHGLALETVEFYATRSMSAPVRAVRSLALPLYKVRPALADGIVALARRRAG